jgi:hypothetical protein
MTQFNPYQVDTTSNTIYGTDGLLGFDQLPSGCVHKDVIGRHFLAFYYSQSKIEVREQQVSYDMYNFMGEVGGALGMFLGLSLVNFYDLIQSFVLTKKSGVTNPGNSLKGSSVEVPEVIIIDKEMTINLDNLG